MDGFANQAQSPREPCFFISFFFMKAPLLRFGFGAGSVSSARLVSPTKPGSSGLGIFGPEFSGASAVVTVEPSVLVGTNGTVRLHVWPSVHKFFWKRTS